MEKVTFKIEKVCLILQLKAFERPQESIRTHTLQSNFILKALMVKRGFTLKSHQAIWHYALWHCCFNVCLSFEKERRYFLVENCCEGDDNFIGRKGMLSLEHESLSHVWKNIITYHRQFQFSFFPIFFVETNQDNFILFLLSFIFVSCLPFEVLYVCLGLSFSFFSFFLSFFLSYLQS